MKFSNEQIVEIIKNRDVVKRRIMEGFKNDEYHNEKQLSMFMLYFQCDYYYEIIKGKQQDLM